MSKAMHLDTSVSYINNVQNMQKMPIHMVQYSVQSATLHGDIGTDWRNECKIVTWT